jgi:Protein of unknown function (DUF1353)
MLSRRSALLAALPVSIGADARERPPGQAESLQRIDFVKRANNAWMKEHEQALAVAKEEEKRGQFSSLAPPGQLIPFKDWDFYYTQGHFATWAPNRGQPYKMVRVPRGFVTDLTSIPQLLWIAGLRPEGSYAYAALVHDFLYWEQDRPRDEADEIFLFAMEDSKVEKSLRTRIYNAVRVAGSGAWSNNAKLKAGGEKRVLKQFPTDFTVSWKEWKARPGVFL